MTAPITEPGVYDLPAEVYHSDPVKGRSLSSSGARRLLATTPARWKHERDQPTAPTDAMELGTAAHSMVLGKGAEVVTVEAGDWRTKAAQATRAEARAAGNVALLEADVARVRAMAAAVRRHPIASKLLAPGRGHTEQTLVWWDADTGVGCRAMLDRVTQVGGRPMVVDYKTTSDASRAGVAKSVAQYGYHQQAAWYRDGVAALDRTDPSFLFVFQEKAAPYLINVVDIDAWSTEVGRQRNRRALEIYRDCSESEIWPGYPDEIQLVSLPAWAARDEEDVFA